MSIKQSVKIENFDPTGMVFFEPEDRCEHGKFYSQCGKNHPSLHVRGIPPDVWEELKNYKAYIERKYHVRGWRRVLTMITRKEWAVEGYI